MPQDDLDVIKEALLVSRPADGSENPVFHSKYNYCQGVSDGDYLPS